MGKEKVVGGLMFIISILVIVFYFLWGILAPFMSDDPSALMWSWSSLFGIPVPPLYWLLVVPIFLVLLIGGLIGAWIGIALVQSPEPTEINIEEIEKELEELEKETEEEGKEEEKKE